MVVAGMRIFRGSAEFRDFYFKFIVFEISVNLQ